MTTTATASPAAPTTEATMEEVLVTLISDCVDARLFLAQAGHNRGNPVWKERQAQYRAARDRVVAYHTATLAAEHQRHIDDLVRINDGWTAICNSRTAEISNKLVAAEAEIGRLRTILRSRVITQHFSASKRFSESHWMPICLNCSHDWEQGEPENHADNCAAREPSALLDEVPK